MFNGSHSRESFPLDKPVPKMRGTFYNTIVRRLEKKMHKKKQRQYNSKLIKNDIE
jgi:hypothetical protein